MAWLDGQVVLPSSLWRKVLGCVGLGLPQVPDGNVGKVVTSYGNARLACIFEDDGLVNSDRCVDAVCLVRDGHSVGFLGDDFVCLRFVLICASFQARDGSFGNVLSKS